MEVFGDASCGPSTRRRPSIHRLPVDAVRAPTEMLIALSWALLYADMHLVWCCARAYHRDRRRHPIPIALAASQCPTARDFVPWRFLVAGRFSAWSVSSSRRPKTCKEATASSYSKSRTMAVMWDCCRQQLVEFGSRGGNLSCGQKIISGLRRRYAV